MESIFVSLPGKVTKYDATTQTATIEMLVTEPVIDPDGDTVYEELPTLASVPVAFQRGGGMVLQYDLTPGDTGLVLFCGLDYSKWFSTGDRADPADDRRHGAGYPVFLPNLVASADAIGPVGGAIFGEAEGSVVHVSNGIIRIGSAAANERMVLGDTLTTWLVGHTHPSPGSVPTPGVPYDLNLGIHLSEHRIEKG